MSGASSCSYCCAWSSLIGFFFFLCLFVMAYNRNEVFLEHKAQGVANAQQTQQLLFELTLVIK